MGVKKNSDPNFAREGITFVDVYGYAHVIEIDLLERIVAGPLPGLWADLLPELHLLDISGGMVTGSLPKEWSKFKYLEVIRLSRNDLSGTLPEEWATLDQLVDFIAPNNSLTGAVQGTLPTAWHFTDGNIMNLAYNQLTGTVPEEYGWLGLALLDLRGNVALCGGLPLGLQQNTEPGGTSLQQNCPSPPAPPSPAPPFVEWDEVGQALVDAKAAWGNPAGLADWGTRTGYCMWSRMRCLSGQVIMIDVSDSNLQGTMPDSPKSRMRCLSGQVIMIDLSDSNLQGTMPDSFKYSVHAGLCLQ
eukprot:gene28404-31540_t